MRKWIPVLVAAVLATGTAIAQNPTESAPGALERRLERLEEAMARIEAKLNRAQRGGGMMEGCRDMRGGGGMGGMGRGQPNEQWRSPDTKR